VNLFVVMSVLFFAVFPGEVRHEKNADEIENREPQQEVVSQEQMPVFIFKRIESRHANSHESAPKQAPTQLEFPAITH